MSLFTSKAGSTAGSGILYFVHFLMMLIVVGGISGGIYLRFGKSYDVRQSEADALLGQVQRCFVKNNLFNSGFANNPDLFYESCSLDKNIVEDGEHLVYVKRFSDGAEFFVGVRDFTVRCGLDTRFKNVNLPLCVNYTGTDYYFLVGSSQSSRRVVA